jgi:hypothetical protein
MTPPDCSRFLKTAQSCLLTVGFCELRCCQSVLRCRGSLNPTRHLNAKAPKGEQWIHEIKYDGYRVPVHLNSGRKKVFTRNGLDWTKRFTEIAGALAIPGQAIVDGEILVVHEGRTNFSQLQAELAAGRLGRLVYYAFDLLWRDGDLRKLPQIERKQCSLICSGKTRSSCLCSIRSI